MGACPQCSEPVRAPEHLCRSCRYAKRAADAIEHFEERFWSHVDKSGDCWTWVGSRTVGGYGVVSAPTGGASLGAHRVAYQLERGSIPDGLFVCHRCDNPPCVRPDHLFLGTTSDNAFDMYRKGRWVRLRGSLTPPQVVELRERWAAGESGASLGRAFGICEEQARKVGNGHSFKHIPMPEVRR